MKKAYQSLLSLLIAMEEDISVLRFPISSVSDLLQSSYGLSDLEITSLPGYDDTNFRITTSHGPTYMLKMSPDFRTSEGRIPAQLDLMVYLKTTSVGIYVPKVVPLRDGRLWGEYEEGWVGRLLEYIEGELVGYVRDQTEGMWLDVGKAIGLFDTCLATYPHTNRFPRSFISMENVLSTLQDTLLYVTNPSDLSCVQFLMSQYETYTLPLVNSLPKQVIHNDLHDFNMLWHVNRVSGIIDFEDVEYGYRLTDLATMASMAFRQGDDVLKAILPLVKGFHTVLPLTNEEIACLFDFIAMRLCIFVVISNLERAERPGNPYLWVDDDLNWARVRHLTTISHADFTHQLRLILL